MRTVVSFDWALKRLLRAKANFVVLEGFLTALLGKSVVIEQILESESNKEHEADTFNRVDLLARLDGGEVVIIEVQADRQDDFFQRMLYASSKAVVEYMREGEPYSVVSKVISVALVYFKLGVGQDWAYAGSTEFRGMNTRDILQLSEANKQGLHQGHHHRNPFPDYYILRINDFDGAAETPLAHVDAFFQKLEPPTPSHRPRPGRSPTPPRHHEPQRSRPQRLAGLR